MVFKGRSCSPREELQCGGRIAVWGKNCSLGEILAGGRGLVTLTDCAIAWEIDNLII